MSDMLGDTCKWVRKDENLLFLFNRIQRYVLISNFYDIHVLITYNASKVTYEKIYNDIIDS